MNFSTGMNPQGWIFPSDRGRGRGGRGRGRAHSVIQHGNRQLIAANLSGQDDPLYKEFLEFKKKQGDTQASTSGNTQGSTSYSQAVVNETTRINKDEDMVKNRRERVILLLSNDDIRWENQPWILMERYLHTYNDAFETFKSQFYYENILSNNGCEFQHFYPSGSTEVYNFSKIVIKRIISIEEWGISPFRDKTLIHPRSNTPTKYNYWDYIQAFDKVFLYENEKKTHTWFIKICGEVYNHPIPNWLKKWWQFYGTTKEILPEEFSNYFDLWEEARPVPLSAGIHRTIFNESEMDFFIEFSIPWIWKSVPIVDYSEDNILCLKRCAYTRFWDTMMKTDKKTQELNCKDTINKMEKTIDHYQQKKKEANKASALDNLKDTGKMPKSKILDLYFDQMRKDLLDDLDQRSQKSDTSMTSNGHNNIFHSLEDLQDAQNPNYIQEELEDILVAFKESIQEKLIEGSSRKGKEKVDI